MNGRWHCDTDLCTERKTELQRKERLNTFSATLFQFILESWLGVMVYKWVFFLHTYTYRLVSEDTHSSTGMDWKLIIAWIIVTMAGCAFWCISIWAPAQRDGSFYTKSLFVLIWRMKVIPCISILGGISPLWVNKLIIPWTIAVSNEKRWQNYWFTVIA